ncbi:MAG: Na(+)-translocating NADH-quinone reductase subunit A [Bacteroidales bacterium]|nr:Na(+)-translocating NADH-quinone reductase subunit A [Bacteroidales bacterium]
MSDTIVLKKGLNLPVTGAAEPVVRKSIVSRTLAVEPTCLKGFSPRLLVKEGDAVLCGSPVLADKTRPEILMTSPVSGTVKAIVRGDKRKLLAVLIETAERQEAAEFHPGSTDAASVRNGLLESGLWLQLVQRPYGVIADPSATPKIIYLSTFGTGPLAADSAFCLGNELGAMQAGIDALEKIAPVHIGVCEASVFAGLRASGIHVFKGPHPAGNAGVQISHVCPIVKGDTVWTLSPEGLAAIGKFFLRGKLDLRRRIAVTGPAAIGPAYVEALPGTPMPEFRSFWGASSQGLRIISGDLLCGRNVGAEGCLGWRDNQVTIIREGTEREYFGWIRPLRWKQFSTDRAYFSWLTPWRRYDMDTNLHGGKRAFLMNDAYYAKMLPMDLYPLFLVKACLAGDIEKMEKFGIYEVLPEDLALCEFVDPSKNDLQEIIAGGIDLMLKEMA